MTPQKDTELGAGAIMRLEAGERENRAVDEINRLKSHKKAKMAKEPMSGVTKTGKTRHRLIARSSPSFGGRIGASESEYVSICGKAIDRFLKVAKYDDFKKCGRCYPNG